MAGTGMPSIQPLEQLLFNLSILSVLPIFRCSKLAAKYLRPEFISVMLGREGAYTPHHREALPYLHDWEHGAGG